MMTTRPPRKAPDRVTRLGVKICIKNRSPRRPGVRRGHDGHVLVVEQLVVAQAAVVGVVVHDGQVQLAVQQEYGFTIADKDAQHIKTFKDAIDYTNRRLQEG